MNPLDLSDILFYYLLKNSLRLPVFFLNTLNCISGQHIRSVGLACDAKNPLPCSSYRVHQARRITHYGCNWNKDRSIIRQTHREACKSCGV